MKCGDWASLCRHPEDARRTEFGAEGIGLCRTEHMFMGHDRMAAVQQMILADTEELRKSLSHAPSNARRGFLRYPQSHEGYPVTIRLLILPSRVLAQHRRTD